MKLSLVCLQLTTSEVKECSTATELGIYTTQVNTMITLNHTITPHHHTTARGITYMYQAENYTQASLYMYVYLYNHSYNAVQPALHPVKLAIYCTCSCRHLMHMLSQTCTNSRLSCTGSLQSTFWSEKNSFFLKVSTCVSSIPCSLNDLSLLSQFTTSDKQP